MRKSIFALALALCGHAQSDESADVEQDVIVCWATYSTLGILGREDGQDMVEKLFKDQAYSIWEIGLKRFDISPLDPRYPQARDVMLDMYKQKEFSYQYLMEIAEGCGKTYFFGQ